MATKKQTAKTKKINDQKDIVVENNEQINDETILDTVDENNKNEVKKEQEILEQTSNIESKYGKVFDCSKLNIRRNPNIKSDILGIIHAGTIVKIIDHVEDKTNNGWFYIDSESFGRGYCLDKYITCKDI